VVISRNLVPGADKFNELFSESKVLVVDDEELIREFFLEALSKRKISVDVRVDGSQAMEALETGWYDLVITDLRMPNVDGMELLRWILGKHPNVPVIMLTAYASLEGAVVYAVRISWTVSPQKLRCGLTM